MKSKVENGEVIKEFREKFGKVNYWSLDTWGANIWCPVPEVEGHRENETIDMPYLYLTAIEAFITNALNQQRRDLIKEIGEKIGKVTAKDVIPNIGEREGSVELTFGIQAGLTYVKHEFLTKLEK